MYILGINDTHDSSACLIKDGKIVMALAEERITRTKNIASLPTNSIKHIFFGHQHLTVSGNILGIPFSAPRSISHPLVTNYSKKYRLGTANNEPNYNIILINFIAIKDRSK